MLAVMISIVAYDASQMALHQLSIESIAYLPVGCEEIIQSNSVVKINEHT